VASRIKLDCGACHVGRMSATKVPRFGAILRFIGYLIVIPSLLVIAYAAFICVMLVSNLKLSSESLLVSGVIMLWSMGVALVSGVVGWILLTKRKVFLCSRCGYVLDRA